ncbi:polyketide synthase dehydratase-domain-containing protein [Aspergillus fruticulosus]
MALEAAKTLCRGKNVQSIELSNVNILRPFVLDETSDGTETLFSVRRNLDSHKTESEILAQFSLSAGAMEDRHLRTAATGQIRITPGEHDAFSFSERHRQGELDLVPTSIDRFYASMDEIGLSYSGPFRAMTSLQRRLNDASATVAVHSELAGRLPIHPTWLDACFQTLLAAFAAPRDGSLWTAFMPTTIARMVFSPASYTQGPGLSVTVDAHITEFAPSYQVALPTLTGDISIVDSETNQLQVMIEDFVMSSLLPAPESDDRRFYLKSVWCQEMLPGALCASSDSIAAPESEIELIDACEKAVHYYLSKLKETGHLDHALDKSPGLRSLISAMEARTANTPTQSDMVSLPEDAEECIDIVLIRTIGEALLKATTDGIRLVTPQVHPSSMTELISGWHNDGLGFLQLRKHFVSAAKQISHQFANLRNLQVGRSSPGLVRSIFHELGRGLQEYTVVDDSEHSIEKMKTALTPDQLRLNFTQANVENGIDEVNHLTRAGLFDLVIVHKAFTKQAAALTTIRALLRPGGFMLMMAATGSQLRFPFMLLSVLPSLDEDGLAENRFINSTREETHNLLQKAGFSGVNSIALDNVPDKHTFYVVVSQALDDHISFLRTPLTAPSPAPFRGELLVVGGFSADVAKLAASIQAQMSSIWQGDIVNVRTLAELSDEASSVEAVLSLTDLDRPVLEDIRAPTFKGLQRLFSTAKTVLWITQSARGGNPYHSATIGLGRSFQSENPQKMVQFLDLDKLDGAHSTIAESFLRLIGAVNMRNGCPADRAPLWTIEPKLSIENGKYFAPRLYPDTERNDRLNALRRMVDSQVAVGTQPTAITRSVQTDGQVTYRAEAVYRPRDFTGDTADSVSIHVQLCSIEPVLPNIDNEGLFCCSGRTPEGAQVLSLSPSNASMVKVPRAWTIYVDKDTPRADGNFMIKLLNEVKSLVITKSIPPGCTTLVCEPGAYLASSLRRLCRPDVLPVTFQTSSATSIPGGHIFIEPHASVKEVQAKLPRRTRMLIHMGHGTETREFATLRKALPPHATVVAFNDLGSHEINPQEPLAEALSVVQSDSSSQKLDNSSVKKSLCFGSSGKQEAYPCCRS